MIRTPEHLEIRDERFRRLVHPMGKLEQLCTGFTWTEGPVWFGDRNALIFSEIPSQTMYQWTEGQGLSVFREQSQFNNGNTRDPGGAAGGL
ncbi:hypothetical protein [Alloyangia mangrovi]|uniref:hypothetical protein n=1 Tax=Alloyangia mangrovi TaxID=1779329 RepID=UPI0021A47C12|nr:hypothetical protein [Alloyangia mangrovi]